MSPYCTVYFLCSSLLDSITFSFLFVTNHLYILSCLLPSPLSLPLYYSQAVSGGTDVLTLSATPIPRTLQMSMANLRDLSLMNTAPVGRREVNVSVSDEDNRVIRNAIVDELKRGGQVFVVVPFVRDVGPTHDR